MMRYLSFVGCAMLACLYAFMCLKTEWMLIASMNESGRQWIGWAVLFMLEISLALGFIWDRISR